MKEALMPMPGNSLCKPKILVVDDVEANLRVVCRRLEDSAYELHSVDSGEKALRFIETHKPDLVLLDFMMPHMNGIDVLNVVRGEWQLQDLPIIMLTARAEADAVVSALEAGANDYISKPIDFEVLKARIENQLDNVKSSDSLRRANAALDERVAMRVLAFDQLREELEREIAERKRIERQVEALRSGNISAHSIAADGVDDAILIVDKIMQASVAGKPVNLALLSSLRAKLAMLRRSADL